MIEMICEWGPPRDLLTAQRQAKATAKIGASWAKWQMLDPDKIASVDAERYWDPALGGSPSQLVTFSEGHKPLSSDEWSQIGKACRDQRVGFMATPFDLESVDALARAGVEAYKIASGDITYRALYEEIASRSQSVFMSTGAASPVEIRAARSWLRKATVMACDLVYPCAPQDSRVANRVRDLGYAFGEEDRIGYSDHTQEIVTGAVAVTCGADVLEKHVTLTPNAVGDGSTPDDHFALSVEEARRYLELANQAWDLARDHQPIIDPESRAREQARRSAYAKHDLDAGQVLKASDVAWLRPAPPGSIQPTATVAGRTLVFAIEAGEPIKADALA